MRSRKDDPLYRRSSPVGERRHGASNTKAHAGGRPEKHELANTSYRLIQRWRVYGDDWKDKLSRCANCHADFYEPEHMNLMCCPLCANHLWKKKNYPPQALTIDGPVPEGRCPWCGKPPRKDKYCDEWCREAMSVMSSRLRMRDKREQKKPEESGPAV